METAALKLPGVGGKIASYLERLNITSIEALLFHLPTRYQDRTKLTAIRELRIGDEAVVQGAIKSISYPAARKTKMLVQLQDPTGVIHLRFFHTLPYSKNAMTHGTELRCYGEVRFGPTGLEMVHPEFKIINENKPIAIDKELTPIYPAANGLSQNLLRKLTRNALDILPTLDFFRELLPPAFCEKQNWPSIKEALQFIHRPPRDTEISALSGNATIAQKRLVFEELLAHRISLLHVKNLFQTKISASLTDYSLVETFLKQLPFQLTGAQQRVAQEIRTDLSQSQPMLRLVQGDVGSGKTVVAALGMLQAVANHYQATLMAPTELLAEQHFRNFTHWLTPLGIKIIFLTGAVKGKERKAAITSIASGEAQIIIGTHALFQENIKFAKLGLIVVDEQHRFGVNQRAMLHAKGQTENFYPHQLVMTATPIPRTLAMSFYADLDCSVIDELPPGRTPIVTTVIANSRRDEVIARIRQACQSGRQAYWVCPLIDESEEINCQSATSTLIELKQNLPELQIDLIHGRMKARDKEKVMHAFKEGKLHLLVATTVIEVGVDVPNASLMIIENAERLGLSQLHQLRGRVGRGNMASHCVLLYQHPLSATSKERLQVMRDTTDGFKIAQRDLELRGPGEVLGTRQTGEMDFHIADLMRDKTLLPLVQEAADMIMRQHPELVGPLVKRWIPNAQNYFISS